MLESRSPGSVPEEFQSPDCPLPEAMSLVERRISLSWIVHGQTRMSMSLQSLHGPVSGSPRSLTIGSDGWLLNIIVLRSSYLAGPFTDRAAAGTLRLQMNFLTPLSHGLAIQIHGSERHGRRAKDWRSSLGIGEPCLFWMGWSRSKIHLVHKKDGYVSPSLQALLRELAAFNMGLCVITTRMPVADLSDHERYLSSAS